MTALCLLIALVVLVFENRETFSQQFSLRSVESLDAFVLASLVLGVASLLTARHRWRQLQATMDAHEAAEETIRESEAQFRAMADASPAGVVMMAPDGAVRYANRAWLGMLGLSIDQALGDRWTQALHPADRERVMVAWHEAVSSGAAWSSTARFLDAGGRLVWWRLQSSPILSGDRLIGHVAIFIDESEQRASEDALRESEERFRQLAENIPAVVYLLDPQRQALVFISPAYEAIWGRTRESLYANPRSFLDAVHPSDRARVELAYDERNHRLSTEYRIIRSDGDETWIEELQFPIRLADGNIYLIAGLAFDISRRRDLEEQLIRAQKMESLGRLAGGVAHDFNNLLTVILSYADLLKEMTDDEAMLSGLGEVEAAGQRASSLTRQLLTFARRQVIEPKFIDVNQLVEGMTSMLSHLIGPGIEIEFLAHALAPTIKADPHQIQQVIVNLSVNARDAMPGGGVLRVETGNLTVAAGAAPGDIPPGTYVTLTVSDTGVGIPLDLQGKLFEPFFTTKPKGQAAGLGLSTLYGIVSQCGGHVRVTSNVGRGTRFVCYFPFVAQEEAASKAQDGEAPLWRLRGQETVLVVEDEPMVRDVARRTLERHGYHVLTACNGIEGMRVAGAYDRPIHLLLTDVVMPQMGGRELAVELKRVRPTVRILFVSGYSEEFNALGGQLPEALEFLPKPYLPGTLSKRVRQVLDAG